MITLPFSGHMWQVRDTARPSYPGPVPYSGTNAYLDAQLRMHLKVTANPVGVWTAAQVTATDLMGYGTYTFSVDSPVNALDRNVALGLFSRSSTAKDSAREIDIEVAKFGREEKLPSQYVVQPAGAAGHLVREPAPQTTSSVMQFVWRPGRVDFSSYEAGGRRIAHWTFAGSSVPIEGENQVTMNLWTFLGQAPSDYKTVEVIIKKFSYCALDASC